ncbi:GIY-YIG nuclease family protein [Pelosinus sp. sgz500959]|uniref:GIY-YIG nuclease family protein n=1 Tax=Pelosinus sp. sgz500959 TaxID=3242472 RepID=UPI003672E76D
MDHKKDLKRLYKEIKIEPGIFQIKNIKNEKVFIKISKNLKTMNGQKFQLEHGSHPNKQLQKEWNQFGKDSFVFEVLEVVKNQNEEFFNEKEELKKLEEKWLNQLQPFGDRGYH